MLNEKVIGCSLLYKLFTIIQLDIGCIFVNSQRHLHKAIYQIISSLTPRQLDSEEKSEAGSEEYHISILSPSVLSHFLNIYKEHAFLLQ